MKKLENSKTIWFNIIIFIVAFLQLPEFINIIPTSLLPFTVMVCALGNMILRMYFTSEPIE